MSHRNDLRLRAMAAAIALALGSAAAFAQEPGIPSDSAERQQLPPSTQQPGSQLPSSEQPSSQLPQAPSSQQPGLESDSAQGQQPDAGLDTESLSDGESRALSQGDETFDKLAAEHTDLGKFAEAVKAAGLADSLTEGTAYTVFAPTDAAWEKSSKSVDELMQPENREELVTLLRAHIVADDVDMNLASAIDKAKTIDGGEVDIKSENGELMVGDAKAADAEGIEMDNLRIYPIDGVLASNTSVSGAFEEAAEEPSEVEDSAETLPSDSPGFESERPEAQAQPESQPLPDSRATDPLEPTSPIGPQSEPQRPGGSQLEPQ